MATKTISVSGVGVGEKVTLFYRKSSVTDTADTLYYTRTSESDPSSYSWTITVEYDVQYTYTIQIRGTDDSLRYPVSGKTFVVSSPTPYVTSISTDWSAAMLGAYQLTVGQEANGFTYSFKVSNPGGVSFTPTYTITNSNPSAVSYTSYTSTDGSGRFCVKIDVKGLAGGSADITVTSGSASATIPFEVTSVPVISNWYLYHNSIDAYITGLNPGEVVTMTVGSQTTTKTSESGGAMTIWVMPLSSSTTYDVTISTDKSGTLFSGTKTTTAYTPSPSTSSVTIAGDETYTLNVGETKQISYSVSISNDNGSYTPSVSVTSSNSAAVSYSDLSTSRTSGAFNINALAAGAATITVTAGGKSDTISVTATSAGTTPSNGEKGAYIGVGVETPVYETQTVYTTVTTDNISNFFTVTNNTYHFAGEGSVFTSNNKGKSSKNAYTKLTALNDMTLSLDYSYSSESGCDTFTFIAGDRVIEADVSGATTNKSWNGTLTAGQSLSFTYAKDSSVDKNLDQCSFSNMVVQTQEQVLVDVLRNSYARKISKAYIGIDNVAHKIKKAYIGIGGIAHSIPLLPGTPISSLAVGSSVFMNVNGYRKEFLIVNKGNPDSTLYDSSCDGTWLLMKNIYAEKVWDSYYNDYKQSDIYTYLNTTFIDLFDSGVKSIIKAVRIPYVDGNGMGGVGGKVYSGSDGLLTKAFLLSVYELGWSGISNTFQDGACLDYFVGTATGKLASEPKRVANWSGVADDWALRTPEKGDTKVVWCVTEYGALTGYNATIYHRIRPALILPNETIIDDNFNVVA